MDIKVALVEVQGEYRLDRIISGLRGGQKYSHAALIVSMENVEPLWFDVHWRWFGSDLREFPAKNYAWKYKTFDIDGMNEMMATRIYHWIQTQKLTGWTRYDIFGAIGILLNLDMKESPRSFTCFEFVTRALEYGGFHFNFDPEKALGSDLINSKLLV